MAIQFSTPSVTTRGYLQYTLTLDSNIPDLSKNDFTVVFNGTIETQRRVDQILDNDPFQLVGTTTSRTFTVVPPTNAVGNIIVYYTPDNTAFHEPNIDYSDPFDINTGVGGVGGQSGVVGGQQSGGVGGQQSTSQGIHGSNSYIYVWYRNGSSRPSAPTVSYCCSRNRYTLSPQGSGSSGWSTRPTRPGSNEETYITFVNLVVGYSGACTSNRCGRASSISATTPVVIPRGCPGEQGCEGQRGTERRQFTFYRASSSVITSRPSGRFSRLQLGFGSNTRYLFHGSISGWSQSVPSLASNEELYYVNAYGIVDYDTSGVPSIRSSSLTVGCVIRVPRGCPGEDGEDGCDGQRGREQYAYVFYRKALSTATVNAPTSYSFTRVRQDVFTPRITGWSQTAPSVSDNEDLYYINAWGYVLYDSDNTQRSGGLCIGPVIKIPRGCRGCEGEDGDDGCRGSEQRQFVFYRASSSELTGRLTGSFTKNTRTGVFTPAIRNWSQTAPSVSDSQDLYYVNAWGTINYNRSGVSSSGGLCVGPIIKLRRGCSGEDGCDGQRGREQYAYVFYRKALSTATVNAPTSYSFTRVRQDVFTPRITGWSQTAPSVSDNEDLYYINAWGYVLYDSDNTQRSGGLCIGPVIKIPRGCRGCEGEDGDCGRRGSEQRQYTFYRKALSSVTLTAPTSGTFTRNSSQNYTAAITNWSQTIPSVAANEELYYVNAWGIINYSSYLDTSDSSGGLCIGTMVKLPRGACGRRGSEQRQYTFYKKARSTETVNAPTGGTFTRNSANNYTPAITSHSGWSQTLPILSTGETLYYVNAWGIINYTIDGTDSSGGLCLGCMIKVQTGLQGTQGACGTKTQIFRKYARANNAPGELSGITYNTSGNLVLTPAADRIWKDALPSGTLTPWYIDIVGYLNYSQTGTVSSSRCIFGPFEIGAQGCRGKCGDSIVVKAYYQAKTGTAPTAPSSATFNGTTFSNLESWALSPPSSIADNANLYVITAFGYTRYNDNNQVSYSVEFSCPYIVPRGCRGPEGDAADPPNQIFVLRIYTRSATEPDVSSGFTIAADGTFSYPSTWEEDFDDLSGNLKPYELTLVGTVSYPNNVATAVNPPCKFGPLPVGSQGPIGLQGIHGSDTFTDVFYRRVTANDPAPSTPNPVTRTSIVRDAPTNWQSTFPAIDDAYDIYYTIAHTVVTYRCCDTSNIVSAVTNYSCAIPILRGCRGHTGRPGPCGTIVKVKIIYIRSATEPDIDTISYDPTSGSADADGFIYPSGWATTIPTGTDAAWQVTVIGYANYSSDGTVTYSDEVYGPLVVGARGNPGPPGDGSFPRQFFRRAALASAPAKPADASYTSITPPTGWSSTIIDATTTQNSCLPLFLLYASFEGCEGAGCVKYADPVPIPPGAEGEDGVSSRIALVYQRSTTTLTAPTFDPGDSTTGTWDGTTFIPATNWSLSEPSGTNQLYMMNAELRNDNTIVYGTIVPIPTGTGSGASVAEKAPDVRIDRTDRIYQSDGTTLIPANQVVCPPSIIQSPTLDITFLWTEIISGFQTCDVEVRTYSDDNKLVRLIWPSTRTTSGQSWNATLNFPRGSSGNAAITVKKDTVDSQAVDSGSGPAVDRTYCVPYNVTGVDTIAPTVCITYSAQTNRLFFNWSEPVNGFTVGDITLASSPTITKGSLTSDGCRMSYWMDITPPTTSTSLTVTIAANTVTDDAGNRNLVLTRAIFRLSGSETSASVPSGTTELAVIDNTFATNDWLDSVVNRDPAGGAFMGASDLIKVGDYLYGVAQIMHRHPSDNTELATTQEAGAAVFRINITTREVSVVKAYPYVTQAARSLVEYKNTLYWFEGSGYLYITGDGHNADGNVGNVISHNNCGIYDHGLNFRSILGRQEGNDFNADYGRHGATMSPMKVKDNELLMISGFGSFWQIESDVDEASAIENWQLIRYDDQINTRLPVLQTNERTGWEVITELARITNSIVGFDQGDIIFRSREALTATLSSALTNSATTISYENGLTPLKNSGIFLIDDELIEYSFEDN